MARILIIDDEKAIRNTLKDILTYEKFDVDEAADGAEGVRKAETQHYDVVLCDIKMSKMDGMEALSKILAAKPDMPSTRLPNPGFSR